MSGSAALEAVVARLESVAARLEATEVRDIANPKPFGRLFRSHRDALHVSVRPACLHLAIQAHHHPSIAQICAAAPGNVTKQPTAAAIKGSSASSKSSSTTESLEGWDTLVSPHVSALLSKSEDLGDEVKIDLHFKKSWCGVCFPGASKCNSIMLCRFTKPAQLWAELSRYAVRHHYLYWEPDASLQNECMTSL